MESQRRLSEIPVLRLNNKSKALHSVGEIKKTTPGGIISEITIA